LSTYRNENTAGRKKRRRARRVLLERLEVVRHVLERDEAGGARHDVLEVVGADLDAGGAVDLLVAEVRPR